MYGDSYRVSKVQSKQSNSEIARPQNKMRSNGHPSNGFILTIFALCNSISVIALPAISSPDLSPRGRPIFNEIECDAELPPYPPGLQTSYHNLRNLCAIDSLVRSGNMGCYCANESLYCPIIISLNSLVRIRNECLLKCDCGANTKHRGGTTVTEPSLDLQAAPWKVAWNVEEGPNPFRDLATRPLNGGTCNSCFIFGSSVLPRDGGGNCSCVNSSSITPRDGEKTGHATMSDSSREETFL